MIDFFEGREKWSESYHKIIENLIQDLVLSSGEMYANIPTWR